MNSFVMLSVVFKLFDSHWIRNGFVTLIRDIANIAEKDIVSRTFSAETTGPIELKIEVGWQECFIAAQ